MKVEVVEWLINRTDKRTGVAWKERFGFDRVVVDGKMLVGYVDHEHAPGHLMPLREFKKQKGLLVAILKASDQLTTCQGIEGTYERPEELGSEPEAEDQDGSDR